jgi:hypothetical protein
MLLTQTRQTLTGADAEAKGFQPRSEKATTAESKGNAICQIHIGLPFGHRIAS